MGESVDFTYRDRPRADANRLYRRNYACAALTLLFGLIGCGLIVWLGTIYIRLYAYAVVVAFLVAATGMLGTGLFNYPVGKWRMFLMSIVLSLTAGALGLTPLFGQTFASIPAWVVCAVLVYCAVRLYVSIHDSMKNHKASSQP